MAKKPEEDDDSLFYEDLDEEEEEEIHPKKRRRRKKEGGNTGLYLFIGLVIIVGVVLLIVFADKLFPSVPNEPEEEGEVAALVNGKQIMMAEVDEQYSSIPPEYRSLYPKTTVLNQLIERELLIEQVEEEGIAISSAEVSDLIESMQSQFPSPEEFERLLAQQNLTIADLRDQLEEQLAIARLLNQTVFNGLEVSENEIMAYYEESGELAPLEDVHDDIARILLFEKQKAAYETYMSQLRARAEITNYLEEETPSMPVIAPPTQPAELDGCAAEHGLGMDTIIYYTASADWCTFCKEADSAVNVLISEGIPFHIADITVNIGLGVIDDCFADAMEPGVPQFVCAGSGEIHAGAMTEEELRDFVGSCS
ncbi:MAG: SurA N-terminal domain-containing protein [Nanoarchaeota archaeon]